MTLKAKKSAGFTILEVLITLGILSIVILSTSKLLTAYLKATQEISQDVDYTQNLRITSNQIMDHIKQNNSAKVTYSGSLLTVDGVKVLDITPRVTNTNNAQLWLYNPHPGTPDVPSELRDASGGNLVLAEFIESITIVEPDSQPYLNIKVKVANIEEAVLTVPKTFAFSSVIPPAPTDPNAVWKDFFLFANKLLVDGNSSVDGKGSSTTIFVKNGHRDFPAFHISNDSKVRAQNIYFEKDMTVKGSARVGYESGTSNIYVQGNVNIIEGGSFKGQLVYTGTINTPFSNARKGSFTFPNVSMPVPKTDLVGYTSNTTLKNNMRYKGPTITLNWNDTYYSNIIIYSYGDIFFNTCKNTSGILYAPNGKVDIRWGANFKGIIVAKEIVVESGCFVEFHDFNIDDLPFVNQP